MAPNLQQQAVMLRPNCVAFPQAIAVAVAFPAGSREWGTRLVYTQDAEVVRTTLAGDSKRPRFFGLFFVIEMPYDRPPETSTAGGLSIFY